VRVLADKRGLKINFMDHGPRSVVLADPLRVQQIFSNLLTNAIKFTPPGGQIFVTLDRTGGAEGELAKVQFRDTGIGIKPEFIGQIFERFNQADSSTTRSYGGLGLGLSIVKSLVEMQNGTVKAESQGKGSTFTVTLPLVQEKNRGAIDLETQHERQKTSARLDGLKILVVDDSADNLRLFSVMLKSLGAEVQLAESAQEGLLKLAKFGPDILLSDISMPNEDGFSLIRKVRALEAGQRQSLPAIALTAYAGEDDVRNVIAAGFTAHVAKPVEKRVLSQVIANLVSPPPARPSYQNETLVPNPITGSFELFP
jgi:CheY-like chemotaxis protein